MIAFIAGGVGLFILGMVLLTDGLKALAGGALRSVLERGVRGPISGLGWGAGITALIQSSSATTFMTIGFVSAGLLSFNQSVGVIFGANLGTTSTGWIVSTVGLKFSMSMIAMPMIGLGAVMRLLGAPGGRIAPIGTAVAGFGLIFVGIDTLQLGMADLAQRIDPASFPGLTPLGLPLLIVIGAVMTVLMQSSSAAVATTLAALDAHAITLEQATVLVVGQNIGTTVKAGLASIGASIPAKRTAMAHVLFNVGSGAIALLTLPIFLRLVRNDGEAANAAVSLAAFHTAFNVLGVLVFMPFVSRFSALVERLVPERAPALTRNLDASVANAPLSVAAEAVRLTVMDIAREVMAAMVARLEQRATAAATQRRLDEVEHALEETQTFLGRMSAAAESAGGAGESASGGAFARHLSTVHATDHLARLVEAFRDEPSLAAIRERPGPHEEPGLFELSQRLRDAMHAALAAESAVAQDDAFEAISKDIAAFRRTNRAKLLERTAAAAISPRAAAEQLEALLWIDRLAYHLWRIMHHLRR